MPIFKRLRSDARTPRLCQLENEISYITVRMKGGLGNQLFQYATARALSLHHGVPLKLDVSDVQTSGPMAFCLDALLADYDVATQPQIAPRASTSPSPYKRIRRAARNSILYWTGSRPKRIEQVGHGYDPHLLRHRPPVYLDGYWQTEKYFVRYAETIRSDIRLPSPAGAVWPNEVDATPISVHVRRGDYVGNAMHPCCTPQYYEQAAAHLAAQYDAEPVFLVFSDDLAWVKDNIELPYQVMYMNEQGENRNYEDMALMSLCKAHIIANSSFSWWGAWLNPDPAKKVVAPAQWFGNVATRELDILPEEWIVLP
ncbi:alpha-1,2-fucosyltransferase [Salinisphaera sp. T5B8]|uniref:alpha-1,2-fucosyltransferase n=1 Tax=Salinisphaera sp. T5B8 TaxID=1304154 RepID=UPI0033418393